MAKQLKLFLPLILAAGMMAQSGKDDMKAAGGHYKDATKYAGVGIVKGTKKGLIATKNFFHEPKTEYHSKAKTNAHAAPHKSASKSRVAASSHKLGTTTTHTGGTHTGGTHKSTAGTIHHTATSGTSQKHAATTHATTKKSTASNQ